MNRGSSPRDSQRPEMISVESLNALNSWAFPLGSWSQCAISRSWKLSLNRRRAARSWTAPVLWRFGFRSSGGSKSARGLAQSKTLPRGRKFMVPMRVRRQVEAPHEPPSGFKAFTDCLVRISERFESFGNSFGPVHGFKARSWCSRNSHPGPLLRGEGAAAESLRLPAGCGEGERDTGGPGSANDPGTVKLSESFGRTEFRQEKPGQGNPMAQDHSTAAHRWKREFDQPCGRNEVSLVRERRRFSRTAVPVRL